MKINTKSMIKFYEDKIKEIEGLKIIKKEIGAEDLQITKIVNEVVYSKAIYDYETILNQYQESLSYWQQFDKELENKKYELLDYGYGQLEEVMGYLIDEIRGMEEC